MVKKHKNFYLSPETSDETALRTICRYELKVKITTPSLKNILNYTFRDRENRFFALKFTFRKVLLAIHPRFAALCKK